MREDAGGLDYIAAGSLPGGAAVLRNSAHLCYYEMKGHGYDGEWRFIEAGRAIAGVSRFRFILPSFLRSFVFAAHFSFELKVSFHLYLII